MRRYRAPVTVVTRPRFSKKYGPTTPHEATPHHTVTCGEWLGSPDAAILFHHTPFKMEVGLITHEEALAKRTKPTF